jgi:hypothetical protein
MSYYRVAANKEAAASKLCKNDHASVS